MSKNKKKIVISSAIAVLVAVGGVLLHRHVSKEIYGISLKDFS